MVPSFLGSLWRQRREYCAVLSPSWGMKLLGTWLRALLDCLGHSLYLQVHSFMPWSLSAACLYGCLSLHSYSISCHELPRLYCPPCWSPVRWIHSLNGVLHCKLCITTHKFHTSVVVPPFLQWAWWKKRRSTGERTLIKTFLIFLNCGIERDRGKCMT